MHSQIRSSSQASIDDDKVQYKEGNEERKQYT